MTPDLMDPQDDPGGETEQQRLQRIRDNLAAMKAQNAPREHIDDYLAQERQHVAQTTKPEQNVWEKALPYIETMLHGVPGANRAVSGFRGLADLATGETPDIAAENASQVADVRSVHQAHPIIAAGLETLGAAATPLGRIASPAAAGAVYGGAQAALAPEESSTLGRLGNIAGGVAIGGVTGKVTDLVGRGLQKGGNIVSTARQMRRAEPVDANVVRQGNAISSADAVNYPAALAQGQGKMDTPEIRALLMDPEIAPIVARLQKSRSLAGLDPESPEMLHEVMKEMSSRMGDIKSGIRPSVDDASDALRLRDLGAAKGDMMTAMDQGMPLYRRASDTHAQLSTEKEATELGRDAFKVARGGLPSGETLDTKSPAAILDWLKNEASPVEQTRYLEGVLGAAKQQPGLVPQGALDIAVFPPLLRYARTLHAANKMTAPLRPGPLAVAPRAGSTLTSLLRQLQDYRDANQQQ